MRWWILFVFLSCPLFTAISLPIISQQQTASSDWLTLLHLSDCELPCWIGIVPGETTVGEAQKQVETAYADTSLYQLMKPINFWPAVVYKPTNIQLNITFFSNDNPMTDNSVVQIINLQAFMQVGAEVNFPRLSDLHDIFGDPIEVRLASGADNPTIALLYGDGRTYISTDDLPCDEVLPDQQVLGIGLHSNTPIYLAWLSDPQPWHGFNYCYNFVRKVS